jgi:hypothetical protein
VGAALMPVLRSMVGGELPGWRDHRRPSQQRTQADCVAAQSVSSLHLLQISKQYLQYVPILPIHPGVPDLTSLDMPRSTSWAMFAQVRHGPDLTACSQLL